MNRKAKFKCVREINFCLLQEWDTDYFRRGGGDMVFGSLYVDPYQTCCPF